MDDVCLDKRMKAWRAASRLSQQAVADPVGWTRQAIHNVEAGKNDITVSNLAVICRDAFGITLRTFFGPLP